MRTHEFYIQRCLQIARKGLGMTRPNPMVGSLIVHDNVIIGEGFTSPYGGNHAEVNAINAVSNKTLLTESTLYVTLEPCSHFGKTPPCSDLIIKHKIPNIVIGCIDDNPEVSGKGILRLKESGCNVTVGVLNDQCKDHHKRFFTFHNKKRPYIILKWAQSTDGFIAPKSKLETKPVWITNPISRQLVHKWRTEEHAILVGAKTVIDDNPKLTARDWKGENPIRLVIDKKNDISRSFDVFNETSETILFSEKTIDFSKNSAHQICDELYQRKITSVIVEGGQKTLQTFIDENLWDEARIFTGNLQLKEGLKAPKFFGKLNSEHQIIDDSLNIYSND